MATNLRETARTFLARLEKEGFNGLSFHNIELEGSDTPEDDLTIEQQNEININYVVFVAAPDFEELYDDVGPYTRVNIDSDQYEQDFWEELQNVFGDDVSMTYNENVGEWEIIREGFVFPRND